MRAAGEGLSAPRGQAGHTPHLPSKRRRLQRDHMAAVLPWETTSTNQDIHPRPNECAEGAVVLLESPMSRRRNLDSKQDVSKAKASPGKVEVGCRPGWASLGFRESVLVSQPLFCAHGRPEHAGKHAPHSPRASYTWSPGLSASNPAHGCA